MAQLNAGMAIGAPYQPFISPYSFVPVFNGRVYIGEVDKDPTDPVNQVTVSVENEDGSLTAVAQPLRTNAAGFLVYNGKVTKFVTAKSYSMSVTTALGALQFYIPNTYLLNPTQGIYQFAGAYEDGPLRIDKAENTITYNGSVYLIKPGLSLPYLTTGNSAASWATDSANFISLDASALRKDLISSQGGSLVGLSQGGTVQDAINWLTFDMFDIVKDGSVDVTAQILAVCALSESLKKKVVQTDGVYAISGATVLPFKYGFDFGGAVFKPAAGFTGYLLITQPEEPVTYDSSSSLVSAINSATLLAGDGVLKGLKTDTTLNGKEIFLQGGNDPLYVSRGTTKYWWHNTYLSNRGKMELPLKYGVSSVTQAIALPTQKTRREYRLPAWDLVNSPANNGLIRANNLTRATIDAGATYNRPLSYLNKSPVIVSLNYVGDVVLKNFFDEYPAYATDGSSLIFAYTYNINYANNLRFEDCRSQGYGWGTVGGQLCSNLTYLRCNLNRVDMHDPFMGFLKILDCAIGSWGVSVTGMGDLYMERCTIDLNDDLYGSYREINGVINARPDFGGWFDGGVYITDLTLLGDAAAFRTAKGKPLSLFTAYSFNAATGYVPAGSPVTPWGFKEIVVKGLRCPFYLSEKRFDSLIKADSIGYTTYFPRRVKFEDADFNSNGVECIDTHGFKVSPYNPTPTGIANTLGFRATNFLEFNDVCIAGLEILRPYNAYDYNNLDCRFRNVRNVSQNSALWAFYTDQAGRYDFTDCHLKLISDTTFSTASTLNRASTFELKGGVYNSLTDVPFKLTYGSGYNLPVLCSNVYFVGDYSQTEVTAANLNLAEFATCENCKYFGNTAATYVQPMLWTGSAGSGGVATSLTIARNNTLLFLISVVGESISGNVSKTEKVPGSVSATGNMGGVAYSRVASATANYHATLVAIGTKAGLTGLASTDSSAITGLYLQ